MVAVQTRVLAPYAAYLRAYEPLSAFADAERAQWEAYVAESRHRDRIELMAREQAAALARTIGGQPTAAPRNESADAYLLIAEGEPLICPVGDRLRSWFALAELRATPTDTVAELLVPAAEIDRVEGELAEWLVSHPGAAPRILTATWHVPTHWFAAFRPDQRTLMLGHGVRSLTYRSRLADARRRVRKTLTVLQAGGVDEGVTERVADLELWLAGFHPHGCVELDYGGLAHCLSDGELRADESSWDVVSAVRALAEGDAGAATLAYRRVVRRWRCIEARGHAS